MHNEAELWRSSEPLLLRRIRPEHNEQRFYALAITADLFGNIVLMRRWGRIGTGGRLREELHCDFASAAESLERLARKKRRRGYFDYSACTQQPCLCPPTLELAPRPSSPPAHHDD